jgi:hypothetical protein
MSSTNEVFASQAYMHMYRVLCGGEFREIGLNISSRRLAETFNFLLALLSLKLRMVFLHRKIVLQAKKMDGGSSFLFPFFLELEFSPKPFSFLGIEPPVLATTI